MYLFKYCNLITGDGEGPLCSCRFRRMTAVGRYGKAGMDRNAIILRFNLFPKQEASPKASPRGKKK